MSHSDALRDRMRGMLLRAKGLRGRRAFADVGRARGEPALLRRRSPGSDSVRPDPIL